MVRNAKDVPGLKILNSDPEQRSEYNVFSGSAEKSTSKKNNKISSLNASDNLKEH